MNTTKRIRSWEIDEILDKKVVSGKIRYLVKWRRFSETNTWEPIENFESVKAIIDDFEDKLQGKSKAVRKVSASTVRRETKTGKILTDIILGKVNSQLFSVNGESGKRVDNDKNSSFEANQIKKQLLDIIETEFLCCICHEIGREACITECGHFFCEKCIKQWRRIIETCPICRGYLHRSEVKVPAINNFIRKATTLLHSKKNQHL